MIDHVRSSEDICIARDLVRKSLAHPNKRNMKVFLLRQMGFTLKEVGVMFGISAGRAWQLERFAIRRAKINAAHDESLRRYPTS